MNDYTANAAKQAYGLANALGGGSAALTERDTPIRNEISMNEQLLSELHETLAGLERTLDTILTPASPAALTAKMPDIKAPTPVNSHVVGRLKILNDGYREAIQRVRGLINRAEL